MLKITVNPIVLQTLQAHFPKKNSAKRALDKYVSLLEQQFTHSVMASIFRVRSVASLVVSTIVARAYRT